jgi:Cu2+-exporting ATPase
MTVLHDRQWDGRRLCRRLNKLSWWEIKRLETMRPTIAEDMGDGNSSWFELALSSAGVALGVVCEPLAPVLLPWLLVGSALPMLKRAYQALAADGRLTVDVLDASATAVLGLQGQFGMATFMVWLINLGDYIRDATTSQARSALESVLSYQDSFAWVVRGRRKVRVSVSQIRVGDTVVVYPGDRIPVDGIVLSGRATVDQRALTGESLPVEKTTSAQVFAATVIQDGKLYVQVSRIGGDTEAAKIVRLIRDAPTYETSIQNYAERWANDLVPYSFAGAGVHSLITGGSTGAASILVIDYGTGIRIAAPTAVLATMTKAVRQGILFKGGRALEQLATVDAVVFDKTGTLTTGRPEVCEVVAYDARRDKVLSLAAAAEQRLNHPVAQAIVRAAKEAKLDIPSRKSSDYTIGLGVASRVNGSIVHVGCLRYMERLRIELPDVVKRNLIVFGRKAVSPVCVAVNRDVVGLIGYTDRIRVEASTLVERLRALGIKEIAMLTGDQRDVASQVAKELGIVRYEAEVLPERKVEAVKALRSRGYRVAFIGDGINDSPALAHADIGIALKGGADIAEDTAQVVLLNGDLRILATAIELAREAMALIEENWNIIAVPNAVALTLACCGILGPGGATLLSNGSAILAAGNSLRPLWSNGTWRRNNGRVARSITAPAADRASVAEAWSQDPS